MPIIVFILTFIMATIFTKIAIKLNILDRPNYRKIHKKPIPKAGGIGIFIPTLLLLIWFLYYGNTTYSIQLQLNIIGMVFMLFLLGVVDDKIELSAKKKLLFQILAAVISTGVGIQFQLFPISFLNTVFTVIWIVGFINAINLIDGLDGLASGIGLIAFIGILYFGLVYSNGYLIIISIGLIGSLSGFLVFNHHPAKIFMGDTGSLPLGYLIAVMVILAGNQIGGFGGAAIIFFLVAIPVYDTFLSIIRRKLHGKGIFEPDRSHFYNLLMDKRGLSHKQTVWLIYGINIVLMIISIILNLIAPIYRYIIAIFIFIIAIYASIAVDFLKVDE